MVGAEHPPAGFWKKLSELDDQLFSLSKANTFLGTADARLWEANIETEVPGGRVACMWSGKQFLPRWRGKGGELVIFEPTGIVDSKRYALERSFRYRIGRPLVSDVIVVVKQVRQEGSEEAFAVKPADLAAEYAGGLLTPTSDEYDLVISELERGTSEEYLIDPPGGGKI